MAETEFQEDLSDLYLLERYPELCFQLQFFAPSSASFLIEEEEQISLQNFKRKNVDILYVYGIGNGSVYTSLKNWLKESHERRLIFLEDDLNQISALLKKEVAKELFFDPQAVVHFIFDKKNGDAPLHELVALYPTQRIEVIATERYKKRKEFFSLRLKILRMSAVGHALMTEALYAHRLLPNLLKNIKRWPGSFLAAGLKNKFQNIPAIICGAGPSLSENIELLKQLEDKALILAGGSTIAALSNRGVFPHFALALDPNPEEYERLKIASAYEVPFIYATRVQPDIFNCFNSELGYLHSDTGGSCERYFEKQLELECDPIGPDLGEEAFSVTTLAIALAVEMGCSPILLNGIDLAYTGMQRYSEGVLPSSTVTLQDIQSVTNAPDRLLKRKGIQGHYVHTLVKWVMESDCIGAYAKAHSDRKFYNISAGGIGFPGIPNCSLSEMIQDTLTSSFDLRSLVHAEVQRLKIDLTQERCNSEMQVVYSSLLKLKENALEMLETLKKIQPDPEVFPTGKMTILEIDFQEEAAFDCLFPVLGPALNRLLERAFYFPYPCSEKQRNQVLLKRSIAKWEQIYQMILSEISVFEQFA